MSFRFITAVLCLLGNFGFANNSFNSDRNSYKAQTTIVGKIFERHLMQNGDWNLFVELQDENQMISGWVYYNPETDYSNWNFFDADRDATRNMELAETLEVLNVTPNSDFLKASANVGEYEIVKSISEEEDFQISANSKFGSESEQKKSKIPLVPDHKNWSAQCVNFIDTQGNINSWGIAVIEAVNRYPEYFSEIAQDMPNYCPNFAKFNKTEKENFWIWFIASMAMRESACKPEAKAKGPNGTAAGLLQLHLNKEYAYHKDCKNTHALQPLENLSCGAAMFDAQLIRYKKMFLARGSYWEVLQTDSSGNGVRKLLALYRPCY
jgi:hypothetical protein